MAAFEKVYGFTAEMMKDMQGESLAEPRTPEMEFYMQLPKQVPPLTMIRKAVDLSAK